MDTIVRRHHGRNIKRLRDILGVKQEVVALELGVSQQRVSELEQHAVIDDELLEKISKALNVPVDRIKEFNEEGLVQYISGNTFENNDSPNVGVSGSGNFYNHPIDKVTELFERLLKEQNERIAKLEKEVAKKKPN